MTDNQSTCTTAMDTFSSRNFGDWNGLPANCSLPDVLSYFGMDTANPINGQLGNSAALYIALPVEGFQNPLRFWFRDETLILIEAEYPEIEGDLAQLQADLGSPTAQLSFNWRDLTLDEAQWVYADRGIALIINPDNQLLLYLSVFTPTTLNDYKQQLFLDRRVFRTPHS